MTNELAVVNNSNFLAPAVDVKYALQAYQSMKEFVSGVLRDGVDFGVVPGVSKPSLLKPGAEKLSRFFGLSIILPESRVHKDEDWTGEKHGGEPFFYYSYVAQAWHGDKLIAECEASINSWEKKYRYRDQNRKCPNCGKETIIKGKAEFGGGWLCFAKKGGCNAKFGDNDPKILDQVTGQIKNPDIFDVVNTLQKMAQKRAIVGVTLLACNASEYFTQDVEDYIPGEFVEAPVAQHPKPVAQPDPVVSQPEFILTDEMIAAEVNSEGVLYTDLDTSKLSFMGNALKKSIAKNHLAPEDKNEKTRKLAVIDAILAKRNEANQ
jgi:ssDNA-binding Zn-finger/Zn-ribbon topoisomerase 1